MLPKLAMLSETYFIVFPKLPMSSETIFIVFPKLAMPSETFIIVLPKLASLSEKNLFLMVYNIDTENEWEYDLGRLGNENKWKYKQQKVFIFAEWLLEMDTRRWIYKKLWSIL